MSRRKLLDLTDPFFAPLKVRVTIVLVCAAWGLFELSTGAIIWALLFLGLAAVCAWRFATIDYTGPSDDTG